MTAEERITILIVTFVFFYSVAFFSNIPYRDSEDILFISKTQWKAISVMMLPVILVTFMR